MTYYNDNNPAIIEWLKALKRVRLIGCGVIDNRSIADVRSKDIINYTRCHFFAGIAGWEYALELAGWPTNRPVWTGSCPCQPFSTANGKGKGEKDPRHLWPEFRRLIDECRPATIFGEQVASKAGREWLSRVRVDLEKLGYAVGAADLCSPCVGAPHIRQRLYWVANTPSVRCVKQRSSKGTSVQGERSKRTGKYEKPQHDGELPGRLERLCRVDGFAQAWSNYYSVKCRDGKHRRVGTGLRCLDHGVPGRVAQLSGLGNAIVPQLASAFITSFLDAE